MSPLETPKKAAPTVASLLRDRASADGASEVVRYAGQPGWNAEELWRATASLARRLEGMIAPGDVVFTAADTGPDAMVITAAVSALGAVELPVAPDTPAPWARHLTAVTCPVTLVATPQRIANQRLLRHLVDDGLALVTASADAMVGTDDFEPIARGLTDPALIMSTSGTTGRAKAALLPNGSPLRQAAKVAEAMAYGPDDVLLSMFGWHHINARNACFLPALVSGARIVVSPRFSASNFFDVARHEEVTAFNFMGALCSMLLAQPPAPTDREHHIRAAYGGPAPATLVDAFRARFGVVLRQAYACTELADIALTPIDELRPGWAGRIAPDLEVRVVDESLRPVADGQPGELLVKPRTEGTAFLGYVGDDAATREAWHQGWFRTRDRGRRDGDWLLVEGRLGDTIRRRGINIDPRLVEEALLAHPDVVQAAAIAVPSELTEDEVLAVVVPTAGRQVAPDALWRHCTEQLARHSVPRFISIETELPHNRNLKLDRAALRQRGLPPTAWHADHPPSPRTGH